MIGVFGGTFDPIHFGHLRSAVEICEALDLERVHMIPAADPPHRGRPRVSAVERLAMLELALAEQQRLIADDRELRRTGPSYMVDTLTELKEEFGRSQALILGVDAFAKLASWHRWQSLFDLAHIVVIARPDSKPKWDYPLRSEIFKRVVGRPEGLTESEAGRIWFSQLTQLQISATKIRALIEDDRSPRYLLPAAVLQHLQKSKFYRNRD